MGKWTVLNMLHQTSKIKTKCPIKEILQRLDKNKWVKMRYHKAIVQKMNHQSLVLTADHSQQIYRGSLIWNILKKLLLILCQISQRK